MKNAGRVLQNSCAKSNDRLFRGSIEAWFRIFTDTDFCSDENGERRRISEVLVYDEEDIWETMHALYMGLEMQESRLSACLELTALMVRRAAESGESADQLTADIDAVIGKRSAVDPERNAGTLWLRDVRESIESLHRLQLRSHDAKPGAGKPSSSAGTSPHRS
jgi:hypothetical protein